MGVKLLLDTRVTDYRDGAIVLANGESIPTETVIWVSGVTARLFEGIPEAVTGKSEPKKGTTYDESPKTALPWYKELAYSFKQADRSDPVKADSTKQSQHAGEEDKQDSQQQTGQSQQDGQQPSEDGQE